MIYRLSDLGVISEEQAKRMWINYGRRGWKRREPLDDELPPELPTILPQAFKLIVNEAMHDREQLPVSIGHGRIQIEQIANLPDNFLSPAASVHMKVIQFKKSG